MMILVALLQIAPTCQGVTPVKPGESIECVGLLWSKNASRNALKCKTVDLPKCKADASLNLKVCKAKKHEFQTRAISAEALLKAVEPPPPRWVLPVVSTTTFVVGLIVGGYAFSMF